MFRGELTICPWFSGASHCVFPVISCCSTKLGQRKWCTGGIPTQQVGEMLVLSGLFHKFHHPFFGGITDFELLKLHFAIGWNQKPRHIDIPKFQNASGGRMRTARLMHYNNIQYIYIITNMSVYMYIYTINWGLGFFFFEGFQTNAWFSRVCSTSVPWLSRSTGKLWCIFHCYVWVLEGSQCVYEVRWNWSTWHASYSWRSPMGLFFDEWLAIHSWFVTVDWLLLMVKLPS